MQATQSVMQQMLTRSKSERGQVHQEKGAHKMKPDRDFLFSDRMKPDSRLPSFRVIYIDTRKLFDEKTLSYTIKHIPPRKLHNDRYAPLCKP